MQHIYKSLGMSQTLKLSSKLFPQNKSQDIQNNNKIRPTLQLKKLSAPQKKIYTNGRAYVVVQDKILKKTTGHYLKMKGGD